MKISRLQVTIEPYHSLAGLVELRVEVVADGVSHSSSAAFVEKDFESRFDQMMEEARRRITQKLKLKR